MITAAALTLICLASGLCQAILNDFLDLVTQLGSSAGSVIVHTWDWLLNASSDHPETPKVNEPTAEAPNEEGKELRRIGEQLLGRGHNPARAKLWNDWWKKLTKSQRKAYDLADGPRPRKRT